MELKFLLLFSLPPLLFYTFFIAPLFLLLLWSHFKIKFRKNSFKTNATPRNTKGKENETVLPLASSVKGNTVPPFAINVLSRKILFRNKLHIVYTSLVTLSFMSPVCCSSLQYSRLKPSKTCHPTPDFVAPLSDILEHLTQTFLVGPFLWASFGAQRCNTYCNASWSNESVFDQPAFDGQSRDMTELVLSFYGNVYRMAFGIRMVYHLKRQKDQE